MSDISLNIAIKPSTEKIAMAFMRQDIRSFLRKEVNRLAMGVQKFSKQLTPVVTGHLRGSIRVEPSSFLPQATIRTGIEYAVFVHEGTRYMRARPFMWEGARLAEKFLAGEIAPRLDKEIADNFKKIGGTGTLPF